MYTRQALTKLIRDIRRGRLTARQAYRQLQKFPYENLDFARIDHSRRLRKGLPEFIFGPGKTFPQLIRIIRSFSRAGQAPVITRLDAAMALRLKEEFPAFSYFEPARIGCIGKVKRPGRRAPVVAVLTAGTGDQTVAEEAVVTLELLGLRARRIYDCGVAGLHRLLDQLPALERCRGIICVAGMEGALASVVSGLVSRPVVAVPSSVGYGASYQGLAALLTMLNTCSPGVAVVNIDNGFGAACFMAMFLNREKNL